VHFTLTALLRVPPQNNQFDLVWCCWTASVEQPTSPS